MGMALYHCRLLKFCVLATHRYCISGCYRLDSSHWIIPTTSKTDRMVMAATNLLKKPETMPLPLARYKARQLKCTHDLCATIVAYPP